MLRYAEIGLFLLPFALFGVWWVLGARATRKLVWAAAVAVALLAATTVWYGLGHRLAGSRYVPAQLNNDAVLPGHGG
jgi:hypothetical protein